MTQTTTNLNQKLKLHFWLLIAACIVGTLISGPSLASMPFGQWLSSGLIIGVITCLPLLCFIPTINKPTVTNLSWLGFFLVAFLLFSILKTLTPGDALGGGLILLFNLTTFFYLVKWMRPYKKAAKEKKKAEDEKAKQ